MKTNGQRKNDPRTTELLLQALETEHGGIEIYQTAIRCAVNEDLQREWEGYLAQTEHHVEVVQSMLTELGIDPSEETPGREVVRHIGRSLVAAMEMALEAGDASAAQLVACECVVLAETKDHLNWELIGALVENGKKSETAPLKSAHDEVEPEEDEHLYHSQGWCRELWIESLGMPAVLPPPEEEKDVKTAIGAARAKNAREEMIDQK